MKGLFLFLFGVLVFFGVGESSLPSAIHQIVLNYFRKDSVAYEIIFNRRDLSILNDVIERISDQPLVQLRLFRKGNNGYFYLNNSAIILFDSFRNYRMFENVLFIHEHKIEDIDLFIYCADLTTQVLKLNLPSDDYQIRTYLIDDGEEITLESRSLFTSQRCFWPQLVEINRFSRLTQQWTTNEFTSSTVTNFHGCRLTFGIGGYQLGAHVAFSKDKTTFSFVGYHISMIRALSSHLNFTISYSFIFGGHFNNSACVLNLSTVQIERINFYRGAISGPIFSSSLVVAVPSGRPFTALEKIFLPFDEFIWLGIAIVFLVAFGVIALIMCSKSSSLYEIVIDLKVKTPTLNIVRSAMGIGQTLLPNRHSARVLLATFLLFNVVLRTAYQGKYFQFLITNKHGPSIQTIDEIIKLQHRRQFKVFIEATNNRNFFQDLEIMKRYVIVVDL